MSDCCPLPVATRLAPILEPRGLEVRTRDRALIRNVNFHVRSREVFGLIGPSGAGKSTLLRALNRLVDLIPGLSVKGDVHFRGQSIYAAATDVNALREKVGMLFQQPVVFPTSIAENVLFGAGRLRRLSRQERAELVETALTEAALWAEVKDRLHQPAVTLSVGQQQRLCLARTLAVKSEVILMDEPTSALDPKSAQAIEELILRLKEKRTIVLVTHNIGQARRLTDWIACVCQRDGVGEIVETASSEAILDNPQCRELIDYLSHGSA